MRSVLLSPFYLFIYFIFSEQYAEAATARKYLLSASAMLTQLELAVQTLRLLNITADRRRHLHCGSEVFRRHFVPTCL